MIGLLLSGSVLACNKSPTTPAPPSPPGLQVTIGACTYFLATDTLPASVPAGGATFTLNLTTGSPCPWQSSVANANPLHPPIAKLLPQQGGASAAIQVTVAPHTGTQSRRVDITIATMTVSTIQNAAPAPFAGPDAFMVFSGTGDDRLGFGQAGVIAPPVYTVVALTENGHPETVALDARSVLPGPDPFPFSLSIRLAPREGTTLSPGVYENPPRYLGVPGPSPSMSFAFNSLTCDLSGFTGGFEVFEIASNASGTLQRLHARVVYRCVGDAPGNGQTVEVWYPSRGSF